MEREDEQNVEYVRIWKVVVMTNACTSSDLGLWSTIQLLTLEGTLITKPLFEFPLVYLSANIYLNKLRYFHSPSRFTLFNKSNVFLH
jgi:hypothetical protein